MNNPLQLLQMLQGNPMNVLRQAGLNLPANISSPQQIVEHLVRTGQVSQNTLNQAQTMAQQFMKNPIAQRK